MIGAFSPAESWVLFLSCVAAGVLVYRAIAGKSRRELEWDVSTLWAPAPRSTSDNNVHIIGGIYDWQARGDFR